MAKGRSVAKAKAKGGSVVKTRKSISLKVVNPASVGVSPQKLRDHEKSLKQCVKLGAMPGYASVIWRHGKVIQAKCSGYADVQAKKPYRFDSLCRLYCMTKSYVTTALMTLVEEGEISLDDPLSKYLPAFAHCQVQNDSKLVKLKRPILIKHLLVHQSGVGYAPDITDKVTASRDKKYAKLQRDASDGKISSLKVFVDRVAKIPLSFQPGENYEYGFSFDIAARVLEVVTGTDVGDVLYQRVFKPLGMYETTWSVKDDQLHKLAASYCAKNSWDLIYGKMKGMKPIFTKNGLYRMDGKTAKESCYRHGRHCKLKSGGGFMGYRAGGGLVSNVSDTVKFVQMLMNKGLMENGERLLQEKTLQICEKNRNKKSWGQGGACYIGNVGVFREGSNDVGMGGASCTYWSVDREDDTATVWFSQNMDMPEFADLKGVDPKKADLWILLHSAIMKRK